MSMRKLPLTHRKNCAECRKEFKCTARSVAVYCPVCRKVFKSPYKSKFDPNYFKGETNELGLFNERSYATEEV